MLSWWHYILSSLILLPVDSKGLLSAKVIDFKENKEYLVDIYGALVQ